MKTTEPQEATLANSTMFDVVADSGREYRIRVTFPQPIEGGPSLMLKGHKPVAIYVTDGHENIGLVSAVARHLQYSGDIPPCVVVGVSYPDEDDDSFEIRRTDDLTPTRHEPPWERGRASGSGPQFLEFLKNELKPFVEQAYGTGDESVLFGHSYGGLFTLFSASDEPPVFTHHFALSPSLWWDESVVLVRLRDMLEGPVAGRRGRLFVTVGADERRIFAPDQPFLAQRIGMVSHVEALRDLVAAHPGHFTDTEFRILDGENHNSILGASIVGGLRFLLSPRSLPATTGEAS